MKVFLGVDLGSTTTKAVVLDEQGNVVGKGLTNTRSNFDAAAAVVRIEAIADARFSLLEQRLLGEPSTKARAHKLVEDARLRFRQKERLFRLDRIRAKFAAPTKPAEQATVKTFTQLDKAVKDAPLGAFFRDVVLEEATKVAEVEAVAFKVPFEHVLVGVERALAQDEADPRMLGTDEVAHELFGKDELDEHAWKLVIESLAEPAEMVALGGTGYGRNRLPFDKKEIRCEILCHGLGAHYSFGNTRTVLDIGGQDTKAIQIDEQGLVTSFQMNDRCAAGCGRYLGYVADELGIGITELGPLALGAKVASPINSTCTVFAGAEIRDRLGAGEKREDVVAGLHRAIVLRAMSLIARSGGVKNELTFSGGVARNPAVVKYLKEAIKQHYGDITVNVSFDSIFNGCLGAALFARLEYMKGGAAC